MNFIIIFFFLNLITLFYKDIFIPIRKIKIASINFSLNEYYTTIDFIDLLVLNLEAGQNLYKSFQNACYCITNDDLNKVTNEILLRYHLGTPFPTCLKEAYNKSLSPFFLETIETILISQQLGTPIQKALLELSRTLQSHAILTAEAFAAKAAVKMVFPLVLFIFPVIFVLLGSGSIQDLIISLHF
ncbi:type II secretion system F family protein [Pigmentibacter sp. JX0631]|uniref:type II secretion system F family protein n=1 Tax=Pigmentibacter sp. JX0631 TaxID=2976982 RepID=UPI0024696865|nr:type II secretion system F family protein [Pigmentibacter sp. JX0631]WGL60200.1 type II secretion system F family protein [Pigmentibacter sp. JX0631]